MIVAKETCTLSEIGRDRYGSSQWSAAICSEGDPDERGFFGNVRLNLDDARKLFDAATRGQRIVVTIEIVEGR